MGYGYTQEYLNTESRQTLGGHGGPTSYVVKKAKAVLKPGVYPILLFPSNRIVYINQETLDRLREDLTAVCKEGVGTFEFFDALDKEHQFTIGQAAGLIDHILNTTPLK